MQEDLEVTGISRSGRVRKKSSKLMDFESPDDIETRFRRPTPMKPNMVVKQEESVAYQETHRIDTLPQKPVEEAIKAEVLNESDSNENNADNGASMETDSSESDDGSPKTPANSLYMKEKSVKKKIIVKDGKVIGRAKAQRKDKGKTRITAYMMWAKEARNDLLRQNPNMDFSAISKRLGEMWANVTYNERYLWKRKAKRLAMQTEQKNPIISKKIISNSGVGSPSNANPAKSSANRTTQPSTPAQQNAVVAVTSGTISRVVALASTESSATSNNNSGIYRVTGCGPVDIAAHLRLLGDSLAIIGQRLTEHEGQIAVSGSMSVLLDTLLCSMAPLVSVTRVLPTIAPPARLLQDTLHNIAYIMPGL